jgi:hypothetical protein
MPDGKVIAIAALVAGLWYGGKATYVHAIKPAAHATRCAVEKATTLGHKHCEKKSK